MDINKCIIMIILAILFVSFMVGVIQNIVDINNKITEMFDDISLLKITSNNTLIAMNSYYSTIRENQTEIEKNLLTEIACLATKNNNDIKEIKDKITTGKKSKRISQLVDENNKLKEENKKLKEENTKLKEKNNTCFYVPSYVPYNYNPYTGVINNMCCSLDNQNKYRW